MPLQDGMGYTRLLGGVQAPVSPSSTPLCCRWALEVGISPFPSPGCAGAVLSSTIPNPEQLFCRLCVTSALCSPQPTLQCCSCVSPVLCWGGMARLSHPCCVPGKLSHCPMLLFAGFCNSRTELPAHLIQTYLSLQCSFLCWARLNQISLGQVFHM